MGFLLHREWALKRHWLPRAGQSLNPPPPLRGPVVASDQPLPPPLPLWGGGSCLVMCNFESPYGTNAIISKSFLFFFFFNAIKEEFTY